MDNILKLLLGVLGVAGLIAMVTSSLPFEAPPEANPAPQPVVVAGPPSSEEPLPEDNMEEDSPEEDGEDIFAMGQPMIDGNPYGTSSQPAMQNEGQMPYDPAAQGNFNYQPAVPQGYDPQPQFQQPPQQVYAPQPPAGTFVPVDSGQ